MPYGIGMIAEGFNRGMEQNRQRQMQDTQMAQQQELHDARMSNYGIQADSARQNMRQSAEQHRWQSDQINQAENLRRAQRAQQMGDLDTVANFLASDLGFEAGHLEQGPNGMVFRAGNKVDGQFVPELENEIPLEEWQQFPVLDPEAYMEETRQARQAIEQQLAAAQAQAHKDNQSALRTGAQQGTVQIGVGEDGQATFQNAPPGMQQSGSQTALQSNTQHYMRVFGMDERTATLAANGRLRPDEARKQGLRIAQQFIDPSKNFGAGSVRSFVQRNQQEATRLGITENTEPMEAIRILRDHYAGEFTAGDDFYGVPQGGQGQPQPQPQQGGQPAPGGGLFDSSVDEAMQNADRNNPIRQLAGRAGQILGQQRISRELEAEFGNAIEAVERGRPPAQIAGLMVRRLTQQGIPPNKAEQIAQEWQRSVTGEGPPPQPADIGYGIGGNQFDQWQSGGGR